MSFNLILGTDEIRLINGSTNMTNQGTVEIFYNGEWGSICDDQWYNNAAKVVCRQLGFPEIDYIYLGVDNARFGSSTGSILLDEVKCLGNETSITSCKHDGWEHHNCNHSEDAGVICRKRVGMSYRILPSKNMYFINIINTL